MFCSQCGSSIPEDALFCRSCGKKVDGSAHSTSTNSPQLAKEQRSPPSLSTGFDVLNVRFKPKNEPEQKTGCLSVTARIVVLLIIGFFFLIAYYSYKDYVKKAEGNVPNTFPSAQVSFHRLNQACVSAYQQGINEIQKSIAFNDCNKRRADFADQNRISNWVGTITAIATDQGADVVRVDISSNAGGFTIGYNTNNNRFSDFFSNTLIRPGTPLFNKVANLVVGQKVNFDGEFVADPEGNNGLWEFSLTEKGSVTQPIFVVKFSDIRPYQSSSTAQSSQSPIERQSFRNSMTGTHETKSATQDAANQSRDFKRDVLNALQKDMSIGDAVVSAVGDISKESPTEFYVDFNWTIDGKTYSCSGSVETNSAGRVVQATIPYVCYRQHIDQ